MIDAIRRSGIPDTRHMKKIAGKQAPDVFIQFLVPQILMLQIPGIAHRRVAIADMQLVGPGDNAFCDRMTVGDNEVVSRQIELLNRNLHQREKIPVYARDEDELLQEAGLKCLAQELVTKPALGEIDQAENI